MIQDFLNIKKLYLNHLNYMFHIQINFEKHINFTGQIWSEILFGV